MRVFLFYREAEEASLYKYKEKTHMAETEEQEEEKHFNFLFPTYDEVRARKQIH